jgi:hypothetical protein
MSPLSKDDPQAATFLLNPATIADDKLLAAKVDEFIHADVTDRGHCEAIEALQTRLRERVTGHRWRAFLKLDERVTARAADLSVALVRWGFLEGLRYGGANRADGGGR